MSPDFAYMLHSYTYAGLSHSLMGIAIFCVPLSTLLLAVLYALRRGFAKWLGLPIQYFDAPGSLADLIRNRWWILLLSIGVGALTHVVWDGFTHSGGYFVKMFPDTFSSTVTIGFASLRLFKWLQYGCSALGLAAIALSLGWWYRHAYRQANGKLTPPLLFSYITVLILSVLFGFAVTIATRNQIPVRSFTFQFFINTMRIELFTLIAVALSLQLALPKQIDQSTKS